MEVNACSDCKLAGRPTQNY